MGVWRDDEKRKTYYRNYHKKHRAKIRRYQKAYRETHLERIRQKDREYAAANRDAARSRAAAWYKANPKKGRKSRRKWYLANREKIREYNKLYRAKNAKNLNAYDRLRSKSAARKKAAIEGMYCHRRHARLMAARVEPVNRDTIITRDRSICGICGKRVTRKQMTLDHIVPLSKGGAHAAANLQVAHLVCNSRKNCTLS